MQKRKRVLRFTHTYQFRQNTVAFESVAQTGGQQPNDFEEVCFNVEFFSHALRSYEVFLVIFLFIIDVVSN